MVSLNLNGKPHRSRSAGLLTSEKPSVVLLSGCSIPFFVVIKSLLLTLTEGKPEKKTVFVEKYYE